MRLKGKRALVTGAASGFGRAIAETYVREGAKVAVVDINGDAAEAAALRIGERAIPVTCDVAKGDQVKAAVDQAIKAFGGLDIVVNNAGVSHRNRPMLEVDEAEFDRVFAVNVKAIFHMAHAVVPHFRDTGGGVIINVGSTAGIRPRPGLTWYNASKGAANLMSKSMAVELAPDRIRVCALAPVMGETALLETFMGMPDTPENRAKFVSTIPLGPDEPAPGHRQRRALARHRRGQPSSPASSSRSTAAAASEPRRARHKGAGRDVGKMIFPTPHQAFRFVAQGAARQPANGQWTRNNRVNPVALIDVYKMAVQHAGTSGTTFLSPERRRHCCRRRLPPTSRPGTTTGHGLRRQCGCRHRLRPDGRLPPDRRLHSARQAMLVATVGTGADADERRRLVTGHLRLKAQEVVWHSGRQGRNRAAHRRSPSLLRPLRCLSRP
jgi:3-oxoacyl-[acyl-carrier protein] reductase